MNKSLKLINENNEEIGLIYSKNVKELIDSNKVYYVDNNTLSLKKTKKIKVKDPNKGLGKIKIPKYSLAEELINSISHGLGVLISFAITTLCIIFSAIHNNTYAIIASSIYGGTSIILYLMSTLYHSFKVNNTKKVFRIIDHCSIYLLIAGTYTPYTLITLREASVSLGWTVFGIIWGCAIIGITFTAIDMNKFKIPGMILYIIMGWMIIFTFKTLLDNIALPGIWFMISAGIIYTIGAVFYGIGKNIKYMHGIFHFFVVIASILFFFSIFFYVI